MLTKVTNYLKTTNKIVDYLKTAGPAGMRDICRSLGVDDRDVQLACLAGRVVTRDAPFGSSGTGKQYCVAGRGSGGTHGKLISRS